MSLPYDEDFSGDDDFADETGRRRPGFWTILISLLVLLALLATLIAPLLGNRSRYRPRPTPPPSILLEAWQVPTNPPDNN
jgi:hypothetical protein